MPAASPAAGAATERPDLFAGVVPRVDVWQSSKTAARFAAASASVKDGRPVLLRLDHEAGHGVGSTRLQRQQETADLYAFLFWQLKPAEARP